MKQLRVRGVSINKDNHNHEDDTKGNGMKCTWSRVHYAARTNRACAQFSGTRYIAMN